MRETGVVVSGVQTTERGIPCSRDRSPARNQYVIIKSSFLKLIFPNCQCVIIEINRVYIREYFVAFSKTISRTLRPRNTRTNDDYVLLSHG